MSTTGTKTLVPQGYCYNCGDPHLTAHAARCPYLQRPLTLWDGVLAPAVEEAAKAHGVTYRNAVRQIRREFNR